MVSLVPAAASLESAPAGGHGAGPDPEGRGSVLYVTADTAIYRIGLSTKGAGF